MTAALGGGEWSAARPGRTLPPGKNRYPFYRRLGWPQGRSGREENLVVTGIRSRTVQPLVSHYTELSYPAHNNVMQTAKYDKLAHVKAQGGDTQFFFVSLLAMQSDCTDGFAKEIENCLTRISSKRRTQNVQE